MTKAQLEVLMDKHGLTLDGTYGSVGMFRDLEIGVGQDLTKLQAFRDDLARRDVKCVLQCVSNREHKDYGKVYAEVPSFWLA